MFRRTMAAVTVAGAMFAASAAAAATVTFETTIDMTATLPPAPFEPGDYRWDDLAFPDTDVTVHTGDVFDWTIRFQPGQELSLGRLSLVGLIATSSSGGLFGSGAGYLELYGSGNTLLKSFNTPARDGVSGLGVSMNIFDQPGLDDDPLTLTAIRFVSGPVEISPPDTRTLDRFMLSIYDRALVPEPSTWAMLLMGFGALGVALRRRGGVVAA